MDTLLPSPHLDTPLTIRTYDVDASNRLKISSLFLYMQESASASAESLEWGYDDMMREGLFWVLSRAKVIFKQENFRLGQEITLETWPKRVDGFYALRDFRAFVDPQQPAILITTAWLLINKNSMRPVRSDDLQRRMRYFDADNAIDQLPANIEAPKEMQEVYKRSIRYSDLDVNRHVNNARYLEFAFDCFTEDFLSQNMVAEIQLHYQNQACFGDELSFSKSTNSEEVIYIAARNQHQKLCFQAEIKFKAAV
jgi:medium-chain acyl-[acyl-carrier-protein] hydrolase